MTPEQIQAKLMLEELREHKLEVVLIPAPEQMFEMHQIRVAVSHNPQRYQDMFAEQYVKRVRIEQALTRIVENRTKGTVYEQRLLEIIERMIADVPF